MRTKPFKAESKRLLELMIHSIYTHREIFLRELISNASDALDKLYYRSLSDGVTGINRDEFVIGITPDAAARTLTITDNGCGMTKDEMETNLGTIARSGSLAFKTDNPNAADVDIIGQFGVGFYSAFMVADRVTVTSRAFGADEAWQWQSSGADGYTLEPCERTDHGTTIVLSLKDNSDEAAFDEFLDSYRLRALVKKYSDYIRYPIRLPLEKSRPKQGADNEYETYTDIETVNTMVPLWRRNKNELTADDYHAFYREKFGDFEAPARVIHSSAEGSATYNALLFIPSRPPYNYYARDYEKGLQLYASGVLIMDKCADLLPDHFSFVKGLVDSQDLSLNISRELLQHDRQLKLIAGRLEKKIKSELLSMLENDREAYNAFFRHFGLQLKYGIYSSFGQNKELLADLLLFHSSSENTLVTLKEYVSRMKEDQPYIYYACGASVEQLNSLPQAEAVRDKGYEILYCTDDVDEFALRVLGDSDGKTFKSVADGDLGLQTDEEKQAQAQQDEQYKELLALLAEALGERVSAVRLSTRLKTHPVCLTAEGAVSLEMEKVLNAMPNADERPPVKAQRVLEINQEHALFAAMTALFNSGNESDRDTLRQYATLLYEQALLMAGLPLEDPVAFANTVCTLLADR